MATHGATSGGRNRPESLAPQPRSSSPSSGATTRGNSSWPSPAAPATAPPWSPGRGRAARRDPQCARPRQGAERGSNSEGVQHGEVAGLLGFRGSTSCGCWMTAGSRSAGSGIAGGSGSATPCVISERTTAGGQSASALPSEGWPRGAAGTPQAWSGRSRPAPPRRGSPRCRRARTRRRRPLVPTGSEVCRRRRLPEIGG